MTIPSAGTSHTVAWFGYYLVLLGYDCIITQWDCEPQLTDRPQSCQTGWCPIERMRTAISGRKAQIGGLDMPRGRVYSSLTYGMLEHFTELANSKKTLAAPEYITCIFVTCVTGRIISGRQRPSPARSSRPSPLSPNSCLGYARPGQKGEDGG